MRLSVDDKESGSKTDKPELIIIAVIFSHDSEHWFLEKAENILGNDD